jgi:phosphoglycerol geranylgeranyltransferase
LIYKKLLAAADDQGAGYLALIDPDRSTPGQAAKTAVACAEAGVNALLVGTSFLVSDGLDNLIKEIKLATSLPVILFPGSAGHLSREADAVLFLSLISGRNPTYLIEEHVKASPLIKIYGIEPISTGYMLVESGRNTSVLYMSNTKPIPRDKPEIAQAHALAAQYLGMKMIYLEAGSGADKAVPVEMVQAVAEYVETPLIVGGGIRTPEAARERIEAGAKFIVTGTVIEKGGISLLKEFADAIHGR